MDMAPATLQGLQGRQARIKEAEMTIPSNSPSPQDDGSPVGAHDGGRRDTIFLHHDGLSRPLEGAKLRVLSLGAGVQSTCLALMAARGEIEAPDCAIFADTQSEPSAVYRHLEWLERQLPFPVHHVTAGSLYAEMKAASVGTASAHARPPLFVLNAKTGAVGLTRRQCTQDYKIEPIVAKVRDLLGLKKGQSIRHFLRLKPGVPTPALVEQWIGISTDEITRLKRSRLPYIHNRHILIEARMSRQSCLTWLEERQYAQPPKSACTFCPFHSNAMWRDIRDNDPAAWAQAIEVDEGLRSALRAKGLRSEAFLHRSLRPLSAADIDEPDVRGFDFANECEGMCGV
jgi:hypothetical protein